MTKKQRFKGQNYKILKAQSQKNEQLFVDCEFPPTNQSLFLDENRTTDIVWKRPGELVENPQLFVEGASVNDVTQGILGNCWFVSACSALTHNEELIKKVIPDASEQEWSSKDKKKYAGIFRFSFWRFGHWIDVVIDDLLPTRDEKLIFARSKTENEFWSALLEKAFAKLYGCYENLVGGQLADALQEVSGGVPATLDLSKANLVDDPSAAATLFNRLKQSFENNALIVAAIAPKTVDEIESPLECGLVKGHAYAVTAVRYIDLDAKNRHFIFFQTVEKKSMIRLQNPWGEKEWNGPWSDRSPEWEQVTETQKQALGITVDEDGEFWMPWEEFCRYFTDVSVCQLFNTSIFPFLKGSFTENIFYGSWKKGRKSGSPDDRAGGCLNFAATFCCNPQYRFDVKQCKEEEEENTVMLSLTQSDTSVGKKQRDPYLTIGMRVMKVEENRQYRLHQPLEAVGTSEYANSRSMFMHLVHLKPGRYLVVPTTYAPSEEGHFMLRLYLKQAANAHELKKHKPPEGILECRLRRIDAVTRLTIIEANGLFAENERSIDPYCVVTSEKDKARSPTLRDTTSPRWDWSAVFYRKNAGQPLEIEVWDDNKIRDTFLGRTVVEGLVDNDSKQVTLRLCDKNDEITSAITATLTIEIASYDDPLYL